MNIRYATTGDLDDLQRIDSWPRPDDWQRMIAARQVVVAEADGRLLGHLRLDLLWSTVPFLALIHVDANNRGHGISRQMLAFIESELLARGYVALLSSSQTDEPEPQQWHLHMGFHRNGIIENIADDGIGEVVFRKLLGSPSMTDDDVRSQDR